MSLNMVTSKTEEIIHSGAITFVVAGNNIIYLDSDRVLYELNISDHTRITVGKNIAAFTYNGILWMQNNEKIYSKSLDKKAIRDCLLDIHLPI